METLARITLIEPFKPNGKEALVRLVYGYGEARVMSGGVGDVVPGVSGEDIVDAGAHMGLMPRNLPRVIPGRANEWKLTMEEPSALVPIDAARLWFGNERIGKVSPPGTPTELTFNNERARVALQWGYWQMPRKALSGGNACKKGEMDFDLTKIGPPRIPKVHVMKVDQGGNAIKGDPFDPWAWFRWEDDVQYDHLESGGSQEGGSAHPLSGYSLGDLEAFIAFKRAEEAKAAAKGNRTQVGA